MHVSSMSRHALRALVGLDLHTGGAARPVRVVDLASERDLPQQFLEQLFATRRRAGILSVAELLDGPVILATCTGGECDLEDLCGASIVWRQAAEAFEAVLARTSAADLAERERVQIAASPCIRSDPRSSRTNRRRYP